MSIGISIASVILFLFSASVIAGENSSESFAWKEVRKACHGQHGAEECKQWRVRAKAYCDEYPDKKRCRKFVAMQHCRQNPDSEQCKQFRQEIKQYCEKYPGAKKCVRARLHRICKQDPNSSECRVAKEKAHKRFCEKHPDRERCV